MNRNNLWYVRHDRNKDSTTTSEWVNTKTGASYSTSSFPSLRSSVFKEELEKIKEMMDRHFNWSEDAVPTHRIPALMPPCSRHKKTMPFQCRRRKCRKPPKHKGR